MSILLSKAKFGQCRWIVAEATSAPSLKGDIFGYRRVCGASTGGRRSFCQVHGLLAYQPSPQPRPPVELAVRHAQPEPDQQPDLMEIFG